MKALLSIQDRRKRLVRFALALVLIVGFAIFLNVKKNELRAQSVHWIEALLSQGTDTQVKIGKISGKLWGTIRLEDVEVSRKIDAEVHQVFLKAQEIRFRYNILDLISKRLSSTIEVSIKNPQIYWRPHLSLKKPSFPFLVWMRQWALSHKSNLKIRVDNLLFDLGENRQIRGLRLNYENNAFELEVPLAHMVIHDSDVSTVFNMKGRFELGSGVKKDELVGNIHTEGTVVNWTPLPSETEFSFIFNEDSFQINSSGVLGGIELNGLMDFTKDYAVNIHLKARDYPVANLNAFFKMDPNMNSQGRLDLDVALSGDPWAPSVEARARIYNAWVSKRAFKAMEVFVTGVYPTLRLTDSHILLEDGRNMHFADTTLDADDLFKGKTYETLITQSQQDTFIWGDWQISRYKDKNEQMDSEFSMQRSLGNNARVELRKLTDEDKLLDYNPAEEKNRDMELGFEYHLRAKDSLKVQLREDEEFLGVERKVTF